MRTIARYRRRWYAAPALAVALLLGACTADEDPTSLTAFGCPVQSLVPQDSREDCGGRIVRQIFSGLAELDADTGEPKLLVASSISTDDSVVWTIEIAEGWTFHNGEEVTASSFVDAWNFGATPANGMRGQSFFADIVGYDEVLAGDTDELSGLELVDDMTIRVTLSQPFSPFLAKLTDTVFYPLPSVAYEDFETWSQQPVGNGRYELASFDPDSRAVLHRYEDWAGPDPALTTEVTYLIYEGDNALQTAYLDVQSGTLDVLEQVPPENQTTAEADVGGRVVRTPTSALTFLGFPLDHPPYDDVRVRRALSLAIDRQQIIDAILGGGPQPAGAIIPPVLEAGRTDACDACVHDPDEAAALLAEAGGFDGTLVIIYNTGAGHDEWAEALANQWRSTLGITDVEFAALDFGSYVGTLYSGEANGVFRVTWGLSYLSPEYMLSELFLSTGESNFFGYANDAFDAALATANAADPAASNPLYQQAEDLLLEDLPIIPLWYGQATSVHSERVEGLVLDAATFVRVERLRVVD